MVNLRQLKGIRTGNKCNLMFLKEKNVLWVADCKQGILLAKV